MAVSRLLSVSNVLWAAVFTNIRWLIPLKNEGFRIRPDLTRAYLPVRVPRGSPALAQKGGYDGLNWNWPILPDLTPCGQPPLANERFSAFATDG
jgi:hypothetical protein